MIRLSIITINLNNASGLHKTIESVINQVFSDYEYIIIDGGSNDGSVEVIQKYADKITYWVSESDNGIYDAMNKGINKCNGEYILFLNSGDNLYSSFILNQVFDLDFSHDLLYGNYFIYAQSYKLPSVIKFSDYWYKSLLCHQSTFIKKELFVKYGLYNSSFKVAADWEFFVKCLFLYSVSYKYLDFDICQIDPTGLSSTSEGNRIAKIEMKLTYSHYFLGFIADFNDLNEYRMQRFVRYLMNFVYLVRSIRRMYYNLWS
jgi:glycosyltransferase involved in cell wall biosynthesis